MIIPQRVRVVVDGEELYDSGWCDGVETVFDFDRDIEDQPYGLPSHLIRERVDITITPGRFIRK